MKKTIEQIAREDDRFSPEAIKFVYKGLRYTVRHIAQDQSQEPAPHHVTGQKLCKGLQRLALEKWGRLSSVVLKHWGVKTTRDFGEIVYLMIRHKWMSAQPEDAIDDFNDIYDFKTAFEDEFEFET